LLVQVIKKTKKFAFVQCFENTALYAWDLIYGQLKVYQF